MTQRTLEPDLTTRSEPWWAAIATAIRNGVLPSLDAGATGPDTNRRLPFVATTMRLLSRLALIVAIVLLLAALAVFVFRTAFHDRIYPAVIVGDVPVGGMTVDEAVAAIKDRAEELERGTIAFTHDGRTWTPTLAEIGATVDIDASVDHAYALGRENSAVSRLGFTGQMLRDDQVVPLRMTIDRTALDRWFASVNTDIDQRAVDATIQIDGTTVTVVPERSGIVVDEAAATEVILTTLASLEPVAASLPTEIEHPEIHASDLAAASAGLQQSLTSPVPVTFEGQKWDIAPAALAPFLTVDVARAEGAARVDLTMDQPALAAWLRDRFAGEINRSPVDARIAWDYEDGLIALDPSVSGVALRSDAFAGLVAERFLHGGAPVTIPAVITKPEIDSNNLDALKINTRLARGDSNYGGQKWQRDTNVEVASKYLNGTLLKPGEEFSFNEAIGLINKDRGFVESGVIINGRASTGDGGGVCQVSTTMFRATILAGLPITDWAEHTQRLRIYERDGWTAGYDASILQVEGRPESEWGDFRFVNDTGGYMLIQSWVDYPYHIVEIYGNDDNREVWVSDANIWEGTGYPDDIEVVDATLPSGTVQQTEWPRIPTDAAFVMAVTYADGSVNEQEFYSQYHGSGNVWSVSPDMQGRSPAA